MLESLPKSNESVMKGLRTATLNIEQLKDISSRELKKKSKSAHYKMYWIEMLNIRDKSDILEFKEKNINQNFDIIKQNDEFFQKIETPALEPTMRRKRLFIRKKSNTPPYPPS